MARKIGKVSGLLAVLEEEDVEKKIEAEEEQKDESDEEADKVEESDEDGEKKDESDDEEKKDESDEEQKDESDDEEKKEEVSAQTVDDDQEFVGEGSADDEDDLILLTADDDVEESEDEEKKDESEDEEKKDESDDEDQKDESEEEEKLESLLAKFDIPAASFVECKAILKQLVTEKAEALAKKTEAKIRKAYAESNTRKLKKLEENVKKYAQRSAARFVEEHKQKFVETAQFEAHSAFVKKAQSLFAEFGIEIEPGMKKIVEGLRTEVKERNLEIDRLNSKNESLELKVEAHKIAGAIKTMTEGMTKSDADRFVKIVEGIEIKDYADFLKRAASVKEKVFSESSEKDDYKSFVEGFEQKTPKTGNLGIKNESSAPQNLVSAAASVLSGNHG